MSHRILVCDDEVHILRAVELKLERAGFQVSCAINGRDAWEEIQTAALDVLITDYQMPCMDGLELAALVHADPHTHQLPVIMLTATGFRLSHRQLCDEFGIRTVISKPLRPHVLLERLSTILGNLNTRIDQPRGFDRSRLRSPGPDAMHHRSATDCMIRVNVR